jgi:hypothetical protein
MQLARSRSTILCLVGMAAVTIVLVGGAVLFLRGSARTGPTLAAQPNKGYIIMEGVDINSNGPGHPKPALLKPALPSRRQQLLPPEIQR